MTWPKDPSSVAADLRSSAATAADPWREHSLRARARAVEQGIGLAQGIEHVGRSAANAAGKAVDFAESVLAPAGSGILQGAGDVAKWLYAHPTVAKPLGLAMIAAPIIAGNLGPGGARETEQILRAQNDPERVPTERVTMASLNEFLEKKAALHAATPMSSFNEGLGKATGTELAQLLTHVAGKLTGSVMNVVKTNPERKALLEKLLRADPVISDAVRRNPATQESLLEAYQTMLRYAPSLTTDTNAVRSFLREVVLSGGHVNYATIKNLIETEKALQGDKPLYRGNF